MWIGINPLNLPSNTPTAACSEPHWNGTQTLTRGLQPEIPHSQPHWSTPACTGSCLPT